jgi:hypothetical protein
VSEASLRVSDWDSKGIATFLSFSRNAVGLAGVLFFRVGCAGASLGPVIVFFTECEIFVIISPFRVAGG